MNLLGLYPLRFVTLMVALFALAMTGCGGGSSGSAGTSGSDSSGRVAVMITDAPSEMYDEIHVTFTAIYLLPREDAPDAERVVLFEVEETLDLLQLRDHAELFTIAEDIPIGDYEKVRLEVSMVELVDTGTDPATRVFATLPSGKIDLIPSQPLTVSEDLTLYLEIDVDATHSLLITDTGTGELIFRPVVFVRAFEEEGSADGELPDSGNGEIVERDGPLLSVSGQVRFPEEGPLLVCPSANAADAACVRLAFNDDSAVFDSAGGSVSEDSLVAGVRLIAMGVLGRDSDGRRALDVLSVSLGTRPTIGNRGGAAAGPVDETGVFLTRSGRAVQLHEQTPVVDSRGLRLGSEAIVDGQGLTVMGVVGNDPILASLVVIRGEEDGAGEGTDGTPMSVLRGELIAVETDDTLQIQVGELVQWVRLESGGAVVISGQGRVADGSLAELGEQERARITAQGTMGTSYFEARRIIAVTLGSHEQTVGGGGRPPHAGPPDHAGPPPHAGGPN